MLKKYRNNLLEMIYGYEFSQEDFEVLDVGGFFSIVYLPEPQFYCNWTESDESHHRFMIEFTKFEKGFPSVKFASYDLFGDNSERFAQWLQGIRDYHEELDMPDMWTGNPFSKPNHKLLGTSFSNIDFDEDSPFTQEEAKLLRGELDSAYEHIKSNFEMESDRLSKIEDAIKELSIKIDQLSKFNWKQQAGEMMKDILVDAAKDGFQLKTLFEIFSNLWESGMNFLS